MLLGSLAQASQEPEQPELHQTDRPHLEPVGLVLREQVPLELGWLEQEPQELHQMDRQHLELARLGLLERALPAREHQKDFRPVPERLALPEQEEPPRTGHRHLVLVLPESLEQVLQGQGLRESRQMDHPRQELVPQELPERASLVPGLPVLLRMDRPQREPARPELLVQASQELAHQMGRPLKLLPVALESVSQEALELEPALHRELQQVPLLAAVSLVSRSPACQSRRTHRLLDAAMGRPELAPEFSASLRPEHRHRLERRTDQRRRGLVCRLLEQLRGQFRQVPEWSAESREWLVSRQTGRWRLVLPASLQEQDSPRQEPVLLGQAWREPRTDRLPQEPLGLPVQGGQPLVPRQLAWQEPRRMDRPPQEPPESLAQELRPPELASQPLVLLAWPAPRQMDQPQQEPLEWRAQEPRPPVLALPEPRQMDQSQPELPLELAFQLLVLAAWPALRRMDRRRQGRLVLQREPGLPRTDQPQRERSVVLLVRQGRRQTDQQRPEPLVQRHRTDLPQLPGRLLPQACAVRCRRELHGPAAAPCDAFRLRFPALVRSAVAWPHFVFGTRRHAPWSGIFRGPGGCCLGHVRDCGPHDRSRSYHWLRDRRLFQSRPWPRAGGRASGTRGRGNSKHEGRRFRL